MMIVKVISDPKIVRITTVNPIDALDISESTMSGWFGLDILVADGVGLLDASKEFSWPVEVGKWELEKFVDCKRVVVGGDGWRLDVVDDNGA
jgi:hypothetical protein